MRYLEQRCNIGKIVHQVCRASHPDSFFLHTERGRESGYKAEVCTSVHCTLSVYLIGKKTSVRQTKLITVSSLEPRHINFFLKVIIL